MLDALASKLLEKETLHRKELQAIFADVDKRPRITVFDDFGGRMPSDKPPIKTPGELAIERGEPWPPPVPEPAFKAAIAGPARPPRPREPRPTEMPTAATVLTGIKRRDPVFRTAPPSPTTAPRRAGMRPAGRRDNSSRGHWHPRRRSPYTAPAGQQPQPGRGRRRIAYPPPSQPDPDAGKSPDQSDDEVSPSNPPAHG